MRVWLHITSGRGGEECRWVVARVLEVLTQEASAASLAPELLEAVPGETRGTMASALLALEGDDAPLLSFTPGWTGSVQWIGRSPFRPQHKRKNWFVGVSLLEPPRAVRFDPKDVEIETMRASGPGGQHVNKTESAVRVTHRPSGVVVIAREERSQHRNRELALARLATALEDQSAASCDSSAKERWSRHDELERGRPVRVYRGERFVRRLDDEGND